MANLPKTSACRQMGKKERTKWIYEWEEARDKADAWEQNINWHKIENKAKWYSVSACVCVFCIVNVIYILPSIQWNIHSMKKSESVSYK